MRQFIIRKQRGAYSYSSICVISFLERYMRRFFFDTYGAFFSSGSVAAAHMRRIFLFP
ncbi:MAG TPA: hypothetical protein PLI57_02410 [Spirochaetota bacterium]|nr:hypothetical protein [Spirochaetota bacterium]